MGDDQDDQNSLPANTAATLLHRCPLNLWGKCAPPSSSNVSDVIMKRCGAFDEISRLWRLMLGISYDFPVKMAIYLY